MSTQAKTTKLKIKEHEYRRGVNAGNLTSFRVLVKETDLLVSASRDLFKKARDTVYN
jgi:hypothetical protein